MADLDDRLKVLSTRILPRLKLLPPFKDLPGLSHDIPAYTERYPEAPWITLWKCLSEGAPLLTILSLLYPNETRNTLAIASSSNGELSSGGQRRLYLIKFASIISSLEKRGKIPYGSETFRFDADKFLDKSPSDMIKVLEAVERVLRETGRKNPDLIRLPCHNEDLPRHRYKCLHDFHNGEAAYLTNIDNMTDPLMWLHHKTRPSFLSPSLNLQEIADRLQLMRLFHSNIKDRLVRLLQNIDDTDLWISLFLPTDSDDALFNAVDAYTTYCDEYPSIVWLLDGWRKVGEPKVMMEIDKLQPLARGPIDSILYYTIIISQLIAFTHPVTNSMVYNTLCAAHLQFQTISNDLIDILYQARSRLTSRAIDVSLSPPSIPRDPANFKNTILDDFIEVRLLEDYQDTSRWMYAFLFKEHLMLCTSVGDNAESGPNFSTLMDHESLSSPYPVTSWDLGPALRSNKTLGVSIYIPIGELKRVAIPGHDPSSLTLLWVSDERTKILSFVLKSPNQHFRWVWALSQAANNLSPYSLASEQPISPAEQESIGGEPGTGIPTSLETVVNGEVLSVASISDDVETNFQRAGRSVSLVQPIPSPTAETSPAAAQKNDPKAEVPDLTGQVMKLDNYAAAGGGFADVWKCMWESGGKKYTVAVKVLRGNLIEGESENKLKKRLRNEMEVWQGLFHKNIVPLWGVSTDFGKFASFICPWFDQGNLNRYLKQHIDLSLSKRYKILFDIAEGLTYLHSFSIVHGDLTSANVLINDVGDACITDFGLSRVAQDLMGSTYMTSVKPGAIRWAAPELFGFSSKESRISTLSDIYSFGCVAFEVLSGFIPYYNLPGDVQVLLALHKREKTPRPDTSSCKCLNDEMWKFISECWDDPPVKRPSILDISSQLAHIGVSDSVPSTLF